MDNRNAAGDQVGGNQNLAGGNQNQAGDQPAGNQAGGNQNQAGGNKNVGNFLAARFLEISQMFQQMSEYMNQNPVGNQDTVELINNVQTNTNQRINILEGTMYNRCNAIQNNINVVDAGHLRRINTLQAIVDTNMHALVWNTRSRHPDALVLWSLNRQGLPPQNPPATKFDVDSATEPRINELLNFYNQSVDGT